MSIFYTYDEKTSVFTGIIESDVQIENATLLSPNKVLLNDELNTLVFENGAWTAKSFNDVLAQSAIPSTVPDEKDKQIANLSLQTVTQFNQINNNVAQLALTAAKLQIQLNTIQGGE
ncbi:hypothetical protein EFL35_01605 [Weissella paramesenteroides]|uniref:hypothetical protein n=1 Tax=Weissella paramesenteroides TaxID=1249 RepID=UPI00223C3B20|nr:hypothetical protein [Weissella paramesenteroides]MCS9983694.1 hypothetical protein [Weissella paramesenteroides]MCS9997943.1 hypothetical protein [Weissella paramesenteroides]MCT0260161.1 hypothetical protein [Weissella paramesenteroides]